MADVHFHIWHYKRDPDGIIRSMERAEDRYDTRRKANYALELFRRERSLAGQVVQCVDGAFCQLPPDWVSLSSDSVRLNGKGICQSYRFAVNWGRRVAPRLWGRLAGRVRARAYFRTVLREMSSWRAISRSGMPWTLASCTARHSAS